MDNEFGFMAGGTRIPAFLYGTAWKEDDTQRCVEDALAAGFRGIDTANQRRHYFEAGVGEAIAKSLARGQITRADVFLQTKFTSIDGQDNRLPYDPRAPVDVQVRQSFASSLEHLQTDFLDSYVLHGPSSSRGLTSEDWAIWRGMEGLHQEGKTKLIGVSNVSLEQLRSLCQGAKVKPAFVQNRCFARRGWDEQIRAYCRENNVIYQGFSLLTANAQIFEYPGFLEIVDRVGCTLAQAVFRFALQIGMLPLTGTTDPSHMREDLDCVKFELSHADVQTIERLLL
jgi:diketogulonate reductase-like aldo/keto reductase